MAHTIKISGVSDELLTRVDARWKGQHYADRSEYVRDLIRRDILGQNSEANVSFSKGIRALFGGFHDEAGREGISDEEVARDVDEAIKAVRSERRKS